MEELFGVLGTSITIDKIIAGILLGAVVAAFANLVLLFTLRRMVPEGIQVVRPGSSTPESVPPVAVLAASAIPALGAGLVLLILANYVFQPLPVFLIIAVVLLVLSFIAPYRLPVRNASKGVLILMHIVAAVGIVVGLLVAVR
jgi:hypothetical protein